IQNYRKAFMMPGNTEENIVEFLSICKQHKIKVIFATNNNQQHAKRVQAYLEKSLDDKGISIQIINNEEEKKEKENTNLNLTSIVPIIPQAGKPSIPTFLQNYLENSPDAKVVCVGDSSADMGLAANINKANNKAVSVLVKPFADPFLARALIGLRTLGLDFTNAEWR
ncbi:MAG TPA: hypothetical protein V6C96_00890, partial [Vampirovibrionales bacterium]